MFRRKASQHHQHHLAANESFIEQLLDETALNQVKWYRRGAHNSGTWHCMWRGHVILFTTGSLVDRQLGVILEDGSELTVDLGLINGLKFESTIAEGDVGGPTRYEDKPDLLPDAFI